MVKNSSLAPGFRFHPTDEELVWYYLRRKVNGKSFRLDAISEIDIYKVEPADLPGLSKLKTRDLEWYFFSALDKKYGNGSRTNRATNEGYWKTTGKDRPVYHRSQVVGMKKTLVYHKGRAPRGVRSNWVMHEYKLSDEMLEKAAFPDGFVLCRVFQKSGTGPKNGEQYGAPLVEEEWEEDDNSGVVEPTEVSFEDPFVDDSNLEQIDLDQVIDYQGLELVPSSSPVGSNNYFGDFQDIAGTDQNFTAEEESEDKFCLDDLVGQKFPEPVQDQSNAPVVEVDQPNNTNNEAPLDLFDELFFDNTPVDGNGLFFDCINFPGPVQDDNDFGFFDACMDNINFDLPDFSSQGLTDDDINTNWQMLDSSGKLPSRRNDAILSSNKEFSKASTSKEDLQHSWLTQASRLLENIPAAPAFASELPSKDVTARLSAAMQTSSVHMTANMIRTRGMPVKVSESGLQFSFDKVGNVNVQLSFDLPEVVNPVRLESLTGLLSSKMSSATSRGWLWFMFFLVFVFGLSIKLGSCIYAK